MKIAIDFSDDLFGLAYNPVFHILNFALMVSFSPVPFSICDYWHRPVIRRIPSGCNPFVDSGRAARRSCLQARAGVNCDIYATP
jgi:hypothetical protein